MTLEDPVGIERLKAELQRDLENHKDRLAIRLEDRKADSAIAQSMLTAGVSYANGALRGLLLVNGGDVITVLTFVGNLWSRGGDTAVQIAERMAASVQCFVWGLVAALVALFIAYFSQVVLLEGRHKGWGWWVGGALRVLACLAAALSLYAFAKGALSAAAAFKPEV